MKTMHSAAVIAALTLTACGGSTPEKEARYTSFPHTPYLSQGALIVLCGSKAATDRAACYAYIDGAVEGMAYAAAQHQSTSACTSIGREALRSAVFHGLVDLDTPPLTPAPAAINRAISLAMGGDVPCEGR